MIEYNEINAGNEDEDEDKEEEEIMAGSLIVTQPLVCLFSFVAVLLLKKKVPECSGNHPLLLRGHTFKLIINTIRSHFSKIPRNLRHPTNAQTTNQQRNGISSPDFNLVSTILLKANYFSFQQQQPRAHLRSIFSSVGWV